MQKSYFSWQIKAEEVPVDLWGHPEEYRVNWAEVRRLYPIAKSAYLNRIEDPIYKNYKEAVFKKTKRPPKELELYFTDFLRLVFNNSQIVTLRWSTAQNCYEKGGAAFHYLVVELCAKEINHILNRMRSSTEKQNFLLGVWAHEMAHSLTNRTDFSSYEEILLPVVTVNTPIIFEDFGMNLETYLKLDGEEKNRYEKEFIFHAQRRHLLADIMGMQILREIRQDPNLLIDSMETIDKMLIELYPLAMTEEIIKAEQYRINILRRNL